MTAVPPGTVTAAAIVLHDEECEDGTTRTCPRWNSKVLGGYDPRRHVGYYEDRARNMLQAAAPLIAAEAAAAERKRIRELAAYHEATYMHRTRSKPAGYPPTTYITSNQRLFTDLLGDEPS